VSLKAIYTAVGNLSISANGKTPLTRTLSDPKNGVDTADLPVRLMLLSSGRRGSGQNYHYIDISQNVANVTWTIVELMLWEPVGQNMGIHDKDPHLADWMSNYGAALLGLGGPTKMWRLQSASFAPGVYEWPIGTSRRFFGVETTLTVLEVDP